MDTITDILARPGEAARQLSEMRAALEAVTARLVERDAELSELRAAVQRDILSRLGATASQFAALTAERDAARAEVVRLRELIERKAGALTVFSQHTGLSTGMCIQWRHEFDAALRGDTAPAQPAGTNVVSLNSLHECDTCGHLMVDHDRTDDGRRVCMRLGCDCLEPAPAGGEAR